MPQLSRLARPPLLVLVAAALLACASPTSPSAPTSSPAAASTGAPGADPSEPQPSASSGEGPGGTASAEVWLPDWADEVPTAVAERRPLRFCGIERPPQAQPMVFVDRIVRLCFWDAAQHDGEAEWVSIQGTMEGGTVATIYRVTGDGTVEVFTDWTQDPFGGGGWTYMECEAVVEVEEGDELIGVDGCGEASPLE
jgi:hypothetical protein